MAKEIKSPEEIEAETTQKLVDAAMAFFKTNEPHAKRKQQYRLVLMVLLILSVSVLGYYNILDKVSVAVIFGVMVGEVFRSSSLF